MKHTVNKGLVYRIHKEVLPINLKRQKQPNRKISKRHEQHFTEEKLPKIFKIQRCSTSWVFREIHFKTTMWFLFNWQQIKSLTILSVREHGHIDSHVLPVEVKLLQSLWKNGLTLFPKVEHEHIPWSYHIVLLLVHTQDTPCPIWQKKSCKRIL